MFLLTSESKSNILVINYDIRVETEGVEPAVKKAKNGKGAGSQEITNELLKYGEESWTVQLKILINNLLHNYRIPDE